MTASLPQHSLVFAFLSAASPPRVVTFDEVMGTARNLENMTLVHEIAVNENFQLKKDALPENR